MKKNDTNMLASLALASIGVGSLFYSYVKMHPIKAKMMANNIKSNVKDMMKDLK